MTAPRQSRGPIIALIATGVVMVTLVVALVVALSARQPNPSPGPVPLPKPTTTRPQDPIAQQPAGPPATGELKERVDQAYGTFEPIVRSGTGPAVIELPEGARRGLVWIKTDGGSFLTVRAASLNQSPTPLFYTGDPLEGIVPLAVRKGADVPERLIVEATDASWQIEVRPMSTAPVLTDSASGKGMAVLIHDGPAKKVRLDYRGESNFIVTQHGAERTTHHVNEIGSSSVEATLVEGLTVVEIEAWHGGEWSVAPA